MAESADLAKMFPRKWYKELKKWYQGFVGLTSALYLESGSQVGQDSKPASIAAALLDSSQDKGKMIKGHAIYS